MKKSILAGALLLVSLSLIGAAQALTTKSAPATETACTLEYQPVCGADRQTYGNACQARVAGVAVQTKGECQTVQAVACTMDYAPVCGKDGQTYSNACMARAAKVTVISTGECQTKPDLRDCVSYFDGCNTCTVADGQLTGCTKKFCDQAAMPPAKCLQIKAEVAAGPKANCLLWYDGCNDCSVKDGKILSCTKRYCVRQAKPKCLKENAAEVSKEASDWRKAVAKLQAQVNAQEKELKQLREQLAKMNKTLEANNQTLRTLMKK